MSDPVRERCETLETLLGELFQWCEDNVPYFGEAAKGSYDEAVYRRVAKALGNEYTGSYPEPAQVRFLKARRIRHIVNAAGHPVIARAKPADER